MASMLNHSNEITKLKKYIEDDGENTLENVAFTRNANNSYNKSYKMSKMDEASDKCMYIEYLLTENRLNINLPV